MLGFLACNVVALWHAHQQPLRGTSWLILANLFAMPIGDKHLRAWWEQGQFRLYVVQVDAWTGYERWFTIERWHDLMSYDTQAERDGRVHAECASLGLSTWQRPRSRNNRWSNNQEAVNNIKRNTNKIELLDLLNKRQYCMDQSFCPKTGDKHQLTSLQVPWGCQGGLRWQDHVLIANAQEEDWTGGHIFSQVHLGEALFGLWTAGEAGARKHNANCLPCLRCMASVHCWILCTSSI